MALGTCSSQEWTGWMNRWEVQMAWHALCAVVLLLCQDAVQPITFAHHGLSPSTQTFMERFKDHPNPSQLQPLWRILKKVQQRHLTGSVHVHLYRAGTSRPLCIHRDLCCAGHLGLLAYSVMFAVMQNRQQQRAMEPQQLFHLHSCQLASGHLEHCCIMMTCSCHINVCRALTSPL